MAAPKTKSLDYFSCSVHPEENLDYVEYTHGDDGPKAYALVHKLWKHIFGSENGCWVKFGPKQKGLFLSKNSRFTGEFLESVLETCFTDEIEVFDRALYQDHNVLTSHGIQELWLKVVTDAKRKDTSIDERYLLLSGEEIELIKTPNKKKHSSGNIPDNIPKNKDSSSKNDENLGNTTEETPVIGVIIPETFQNNSGNIPELTQQSKVKESIVKDRKVKESKDSSGAGPDKPVPTKKNVDKEETEPYWQQIVETWFSFVKEKFKEPPLFAGQDPKFLKSIIGKLKKRAAAKNVEWNEKSATERLKVFLDHAFADKWLAEHFLLKTLDEKFESIGRDLKNISEKLKNHSVLSPADELQQMYDEMLGGSKKLINVSKKHIDLLHEKGMIEITEEHQSIAIKKRMSSLTGSNQAKDLRLYQLYEKNPASAMNSDSFYPPVLYRIVTMELFFNLDRAKRGKIFETSS